jgi:hypothetical protein
LPRHVRYAAAALLLLGFAAGCGDGGGSSPEQRVAALVERLRSDPQRLDALLRRMPKGADLQWSLEGELSAFERSAGRETAP